MNGSPRILNLTGAPHPKALVQSVNAATGTLVFAWLNSNGAQVDSGGSVARFTPLDTVDSASEVSDAVLSSAIENPPADALPARRQDTRVIISRLTAEEKTLLFGSSNTDVKTLLAMATAEGAIREDDPAFTSAVLLLDSLNIIAASRWNQLLAP